MTRVPRLARWSPGSSPASAVMVMVLTLARGSFAEPEVSQGEQEAQEASQGGDASALTESRRLFREANLNYERGNYAAALDLLQRAYALYPADALLLNIAQAQRQLSLCDESRRTYLDYLDREKDPALRERARVGLARLGECRSKRPTADVPERPQNEDPAPSPTSLPARVWIGWIATGTLAAAAATSGVLTMAALEDRDDLQNRPTSREEAENTEDRARRLALATDILTAATIAAAGVSLYFTLSSSDSPAQRGRMETLRSMRWTAGVSPTGGWVRAEY